MRGWGARVGCEDTYEGPAPRARVPLSWGEGRVEGAANVVLTCGRGTFPVCLAIHVRPCTDLTRSPLRSERPLQAELRELDLASEGVR